MSDQGILQKPVPFGKYYLLEKINTGGMAEVFKAKSFGVEGFQRVVAVKKILPAIAEDKEFISMFVDEAKITVQLNHANIASVYELGKVEESYFIAMEYVSGRDLKTIYDRAAKFGERLTVPMVCYVMMKLCEGLDYAHNKRNEQGLELEIIHRDISPQNAIVSYEGDVKLIDFGIAKAQGKSSSTQVGILKGKFSYMSPEQVRGAKLDRRSDVFSLGIVFYEVLTLQRLFLGSSDFSTLEKIRKVEISPPTLFDSQIPQGLEDIILKTLARDVDQRYQSAHELQEAIHRFMFDQNLYFTNKDLAAYMRKAFSNEINFEHKKLEYYSSLKQEDLDRSKAKGKGGGLDWDDDETETNVYDRHDFRGAKSKADVLASLDNIDLPDDGIIYKSKEVDPIDLDDDIDAPTKAMGTLNHLSLPLNEPVPKGGAFPAPPQGPNPWANAGANPNAQVHSAYGMAPAQPEPKSKIGLIVGLIVLLLALGGAVVWLITQKSEVPVEEPEIAMTQVRFSLDVSSQALLSKLGIDPRVSITLDSKSIAKRALLLKPLEQGEITPGKTYQVTASIEGFEDFSTSFVGANKGVKEVELTFTPMKNAGFVLEILPKDADVFLNNKQIPGANGHFEQRGMIPQSYTLKVSRPNFVEYSRPMQISAGTLNTPIKIELKPFGNLTFQSTLSEANFTLIDLDGGEGATGTVGGALVKIHPDHRYKITATHPKRLELVFDNWTLPAGQTQAQITLEFVKKSSESSSRTEHRPRTSRKDPKESASASKAIKKDPPKERPKDPPPAKKKTPGILLVNCKPPAEVKIKGKSYGMTPKKLELPPGSYKVHLINKEKGIDIFKNVTVKSGEVRKVIYKK